MEISSSILHKNLLSLESVNPQLAHEVRQSVISNIDFEIKNGLASTICVSGIQLSSRHNPRREAELQASLLAESQEISLYGIGLGYLPEKILKRSSVLKLNVKLLNLSLFALVLSAPDQTNWINSERVSITLAKLDSDVRAPYFALMPDLLLADESSENIKNILYTLNYNYFLKKQF